MSSGGTGVATQRGEPIEDVRAPARAGGSGEGDALLDEVPVGLEVLDDLAQARRAAERSPAEELDELGGGEPGHRLTIGVVEQFVEEILPALVEGELALQLVEHVEAGRQPGLDGELEQDAPGEGVQRADRGVVEALQRGLAQRPVARLVELGTEAVTQLGGGLLRERDGGDDVDRHALVDEREDAGDEGGGLAGAGAGLDEQRRRGVGADAVARGLVRRLVCEADALVAEERQLLSHRRQPPRRRAGTGRRARGRTACAPSPPTAARCRGRRDRRTSRS